MTYTGDATAAAAPGADVDITEPVDGDRVNAASVNGAFSKLADEVAFLKSPPAPSAVGYRVLLAKSALTVSGTTIYRRHYARSNSTVTNHAYEVTINCSFDNTSGNWSKDRTGVVATCLRQSLVGFICLRRDAGNDADWADASIWDSQNVYGESVGTTGDISADGNIYAGAALSVGTDLGVNGTGTFGNGIDVEGGDIVGQTGAGASGTALRVHHVRFGRQYAQYGTPFAADASDFTLTGWGTGATATVASGSTDTCGSISITVGAGPSGAPTISAPWKDGNWSTPGPQVIWWQTGGSGSGNSRIHTDNSTTTNLAMTWDHTLAPGGGITLNWRTLGLA